MDIRLRITSASEDPGGVVEIECAACGRLVDVKRNGGVMSASRFSGPCTGCTADEDEQAGKAPSASRSTRGTGDSRGRDDD